MTVTELRDRLNTIIEDGNGDNTVILRAGRYVSDKRRRSGTRYEDSSFAITYACNGTLSFGEESGYDKCTELHSRPGEMIQDWK